MTMFYRYGGYRHASQVKISCNSDFIMRWRSLRFFFDAENKSSKQGHFAKNDSLLVGNTFPKPNECSAGAAVVGTLLYSLQAMNTRINHTSERLSPEFPSGKIAKNQLYYYRCFRCGRKVRKMLRVMLADL